MGKVGRRGPHKERKRRLAEERARIAEEEEQRRRERQKKKAERVKDTQIRDWAHRVNHKQWHYVNPPHLLEPNYCWEAVKYLNHIRRERRQKERPALFSGVLGYASTMNRRR